MENEGERREKREIERDGAGRKIGTGKELDCFILSDFCRVLSSTLPVHYTWNFLNLHL